MKNETMMIDERNRIANEIHDTVSPRLFGIVYALHDLQSKSSGMTTEELNAELTFLAQSANATLKELRTAIYRLNSEKNEEASFFVYIKKYLDEYVRLYGIQIDCQLIGDETAISALLKQALYRIICEACGNAVRHGRCSEIKVQLTLLEEKTILRVQDNGIGIDMNRYENIPEKGIGLLNMQHLITSFAGIFTINGEKNRGTEIQIEIPSETLLKKEKVRV